MPGQIRAAGNTVVMSTVILAMSSQPHPSQTQSKPSRTSPLEAGLGFRLDRLVRTMRTAWSAELVELDLTPPQAAVLRGVASAEGTSVRALARHLGGDPMNIKRCVDELERRGMVASTTDPDDRRPRLLSLTADGWDAAVEVDRRVEAQDASLTSEFTGAERARFDATLSKLEAALGIGTAGEASDGTSAPGHTTGHGRTGAASGSHVHHPTDTSADHPHQRQPEELR